MFFLEGAFLTPSRFSSQISLFSKRSDFDFFLKGSQSGLSNIADFIPKLFDAYMSSKVIILGAEQDVIRRDNWGNIIG